MAAFESDRLRVAVATLSAAVTGSAIVVLLAFGWPRPILAWMRVIEVRAGYPAAGKLALATAAFFGIATISLAAAIAVAHWLLWKLKLPRPWGSLVLLMGLVFGISFIAEATHQVVHVSGSLTASDATGPIIEDAHLTSHGWETIARRALTASGFAALLAAIFSFTMAVQRKRNMRS
jgi:hypothetical protein